MWGFFSFLSLLMDSIQCIAGVIVNIPMPISFAFSCAASEAILAASRDRVGRLFVADMIDCGFIFDMFCGQVGLPVVAMVLETGGRVSCWMETLR